MPNKEERLKEFVKDSNLGHLSQVSKLLIMGVKDAIDSGATREEITKALGFTITEVP